MAVILGDFVEKGETQEYLILNFSPNSLLIQERWRNNGLSADFIADYWSTFFPSLDISTQERQAEIKHAIAYIANELLENAMKFSYDTPFRRTIGIGLYLSDNYLRFYVTNSISPQAAGQFQEFIRKLQTEDTDSLYIRQLESNAGEEQNLISCLGLLTIIADYRTRAAWKFETVGPEIIAVTTMVELAI